MSSIPAVGQLDILETNGALAVVHQNVIEFDV